VIVRGDDAGRCSSAAVELDFCAVIDDTGAAVEAHLCAASVRGDETWRFSSAAVAAYVCEGEALRRIMTFAREVPDTWTENLGTATA